MKITAFLYVIPLLLILGGSCVGGFLWLMRPLQKQQFAQRERGMQRASELRHMAPARTRARSNDVRS